MLLLAVQFVFVRDFPDHHWRYSYVYGVAYDNSTGRIYITDYNNRVQVMDALSGRFLFEWGSYGNGNYEFSRPRWIKVCGNEVFVLDYNNDMVKIYSLNGTFITSINLREVYSGISPYAITVEESGGVAQYLYVVHWYTGTATSVPVLLKYKRENDGNYTFVGYWGYDPVDRPHFNRVYGINVLDGYLYFARLSSTASVGGVGRLDLSDMKEDFFFSNITYVADVYPLDNETYLLSRESPHVVEERFNNGTDLVLQKSWSLLYEAYELAFDGDHIFVALASGSYGVAVCDYSSGLCRYYSSAFLPSSSLDGLNTPRGIWVGNDGKVYITQVNDDSLKIYDADFSPVVKITNQMSDPYGVSLGPDGVIYVAQNGASRIRMYDSSSFAYLGELNYSFNRVTDVKFDSRGNMYVVDTNNHAVKRRSVNGTWSVIIGSDLYYPRSIWLYENSTNVGTPDIYVANTGKHTIRKYVYNGTAWVLDTSWAGGDGILGVSGSSGSGNDKFNNPWSVAVDSEGNVYVADTSNIRIQMFDKNGNYLATIVDRDIESFRMSHGKYYPGTATAYWLAVGPGDKLYFVDSQNHRVQVMERLDRPAHPSSVEARVLGDSVVRLTWRDNSMIEDGYRVYVSTDGGTTYNLLANLGPNQTSFDDTGIFSEGERIYRVVSFKGSGESNYLNRDGEPLASCHAGIWIINSPDSLSASQYGDGGVNLTWVDRSQIEDGYRVEYRVGGNSTWLLLAELPANSTSYLVPYMGDGEKIYFRVFAFKNTPHGRVYSPSSDEVEFVPLRKPSGISVERAGAVRVRLSWSDCAGEDGYIVERRRGTGEFVQVAILGPDVLSYEDEVDDGYNYTYRVRQKKESWVSNPSSEVSIWIDLLPPQDFQVFLGTNNNPVLVWSDTSRGNDGYIVERRLSTEANFTQIAVVSDPNATTYQDFTVDGDDEGKTFVYRVRAYKDFPAVNSNYTSEVEVFVMRSPSGLQAISFYQDGQIKVRLSWEDNSNVESGFVVERKINSGAWEVIGTIFQNTCEFVDDNSSSGFYEGPELSYRVKAYAGGWSSGYSNVETVTPLNPPSILNVTYSGGLAQIDFTDSSSFEEGYLIYRSVDNSSRVLVKTLLKNVDYIDGGAISWSEGVSLYEGANLTYFVTPFISGEEHEEFASSSVVIPLSPVSSLTLSQYSYDVVKISWVYHSAGADGFIIERKVGASSYVQIASVPYDNSTTHYFYEDEDTFTNGMTYYYRVRAYRSSSGAVSEWVEANITISTLLAPSNLTVVSVGEVEVTLSWTDNSAGEDGFSIEISRDGSTWNNIMNVTSTIAVVSSLEPLTSYVFRVRAFSNSTFSSPSEPVYVTTLFNSPDSLRASPSGENVVELTWNDNSVAEDGYVVERRSSGVSWKVVAVLPENTDYFRDVVPQPGKTYFYRVRAFVGSRYSNYTSVVSVETSLNPPSSLVARYDSSKGCVVLNWIDSSNSEEGYIVERSIDGASFNQIVKLPANTTTYEDKVEEGHVYRYRVAAYSGAVVSSFVESGSVEVKRIVESQEGFSSVIVLNNYVSDASAGVVFLARESCQISIYSVLGKKVAEFRITSGERFKWIPPLDLPSGLYVAVISTSSEKVKRYIVVKR